MLNKLPYRFEPKRELGRTGFHASAVGIRGLPGGSGSEDAVAMMRRALESGLNVMDASPACGNASVGVALRDLRLGVFVIDSIRHLDRPIASQVDASLHSLGLKTVDLMVFSCVTDLNEWARICRRGGPMQELAVCVSDGKCRFRGLASDSSDILVGAVEAGLVDAIVIPVDPEADERLATEVISRARRANVGVIGTCRLNTGRAGGPSLEERVAFSLMIGPDVVILDAARPEEQERALKAVHRFDPISDAEVSRIRSKAESAARADAGVAASVGDAFTTTSQS